MLFLAAEKHFLTEVKVGVEGGSFTEKDLQAFSAVNLNEL